ncbi:MAG: CRISPR-associated protein, Csm4 family [Calditrichia bacterium]
MMPLYKCTVQIKSFLATPLQSDTIWGHICWGLLFHEGEPSLKQFLKEYKKGVPLAVSDGFPHGYLPMPLFNPVPPSKDLSLGEIKLTKLLKKTAYLPVEIYIKNGFSLNATTVLQEIKSVNRINVVRSSLMHNTINRLSGFTVEEQSPFLSEIFYLSDYSEDAAKEMGESLPNDRYDIYIRSIYSKERLEELLRWAFVAGYGADRSVGKGYLIVENLEQITDFPEQGNRGMALGNFVFDRENELSELKANVMTKYGKIGEPLNRFTNPFKKPVILFTSGSTFNAESAPDGYVGRLLDSIHSDPSIMHNAIAPVIYFKEEADETV